MTQKNGGIVSLNIVTQQNYCAATSSECVWFLTLVAMQYETSIDKAKSILFIFECICYLNKHRIFFFLTLEDLMTLEKSWDHPLTLEKKIWVTM